MKDFQATRTNGQPYRGVRYREHETRRHGIGPDKYYFLKFWARGRTMTEGVGWASEGTKPSDAYKRLIDIKSALKAGTYETPGEKKAREEKERAEQEAQEAEEKKAALTFKTFWSETYLPDLKANKRPGTVKSEISLYDTWIKPAMGEKPLSMVGSLDVERLKRDMQKQGRQASTIRTALAVIRQLFNMARRHKLYIGENPVKEVRFPKADNRRTRFVSEEEAAILLEALWKKSPDIHDQALFSLGSGARFSELANLTWKDVNIDRGEALLTGIDRASKSGKSRTVPLTEEVVEMLKRRHAEANHSLVFPSKTGEPMGQISNSFQRVVDDLGWNDDVTDYRQKIVFHSLRHTYCSWLAIAGVPLYTLAQLSGHETLSMVQRYSHLNPGTLREAVSALNGSVKVRKAPKVVELQK